MEITRLVFYLKYSYSTSVFNTFYMKFIVFTTLIPTKTRTHTHIHTHEIRSAVKKKTNISKTL